MIITRPPHNPGQWPRLMRAETAAAYVDEVSAEAFRRRVGTVYPRPITISGRGQVWPREDLDQAIARLAGRTNGTGPSLADDL